MLVSLQPFEPAMIREPMLIINAPHWRGPALYALALLLFACLDATTKYLAQSYNVPLIVAIRYLVHFALMLLLLAPLEGRRLIETRHPGWAILRGASLATVSVCVGLALSRMPVAETTAIVFLAPIAVVMLAVPLLGETLGRLGWGACLTGFIGVLLIARPGSGLDHTGMMFAFGAVIAATLYQLLSRYLASRERTVTLLFFTAVFGSLAYGLLLPWTLHGPHAKPDANAVISEYGVHRRIGTLPLHGRLPACLGINAGTNELSATPLGRPARVGDIRSSSRSDQFAGDASDCGLRCHGGAVQQAPPSG
jgi:uncharacterized membrane protein